MAEIHVYVDGACVNNGQKNATAGYGIYFGENDARNEYGSVQGKQSNNTGELTAFIRCLEILHNDDNLHKKKTYIHTDSEYVMKCATSYGNKLEKTEWKTSNGKQVPNLELVQTAYHMYKKVQKYVFLQYVKAHTDNTDIHSIGNAEADRLANLGAGKTSQKQIIKIDIAYAYKDEAKALGAKWNQNGKYWYVDSDTADDVFAKLKTYVKTKKYIKIDYSKKDKAKKHGARWDADAKSWYYIDEDISEENKRVLLSL